MKHNTSEPTGFYDEATAEPFSATFGPMLNRVFAAPRSSAIRITPKPLGPGYRGRRARRQAFAYRSRMCRLLTRIYRASRSALDAQLQRAMEAWIVTGTAFVDGSGEVVDWRKVRL